MIWITDYIDSPDVEKEILGRHLSESACENIEVLMVWHQKIDHEFLKQFPKLKGIIRYGVGTDNVEIASVKEKGIIFCNNPDYGVEEVSQTALAMILDSSRGVSRYNALAKDLPQNWQQNTITDLKRISESNLGIIGAGRIGGRVALMAKFIGYKVKIYDPYKERGFEKLLNVGRFDSLDELLNWSNVVTLHCPLTNETKGMVDSDFINSMKQGSSLVNCSRGGILRDLSVLKEALTSGKLRYCGLDVLPDEPPSSNDQLIQKWKAEKSPFEGRLVINMHTSYYSNAAFREMRVNAAKNALRILNGQTPHNRVV